MQVGRHAEAWISRAISGAPGFIGAMVLDRSTNARRDRTRRLTTKDVAIECSAGRSRLGVRARTLGRREPPQRCADCMDAYYGQLGSSLRGSGMNGVRDVVFEARAEALRGGRSSAPRDRAQEFGALGPSSPSSREVTEESQGCVVEGLTAEGTFLELPDTFPNGPSECVCVCFRATDPPALPRQRQRSA